MGKPKKLLDCYYYRVNNDMRTTITTYCVLMLLMLTYSLGSAAVNLTGMAVIESESCELSTSSSLECVDSENLGSDERDSYTDTKSSWTSDIELGNKPISETYNFNFLRIRRVAETSSLLRGIFLILSQHQNSLVLDQSKIYYSDKNPHYASFSSEYYIYTLRQILI